ncbi:MAG TPA: cytochrome C oxidase subunit IV family protein [Gemmatimonadales bacterium]|jgi:heme/copper-type cytochrome/quinol oxidase subunit 4|nr:cytochrome C oxidase subunit IV family protein [Gemmatimonadales bacterium]HEV8599851.1 cytochrome C oxidase subunit IV family protein [Gemmatimonadales bacterium]
MEAQDAHAHDQHAHPTPALYLKVALVLFVLTAMEVLAFEAGRGGLGASLRPVFEPIVVLLLVVLSAAKFALVAMFYMHLKQDPRLLANLFVFPLLIAAVIIAALIVLFSYWRAVGAH